MKRIGIVTINYNNLEGLKKTFESIQNQRFNDFEYVVIDGNSDDGSKELILQNKDIINEICIEKDRGIYDAMNKGVALSKAEYILMLNSGDTFYNENSLKKIYEFIKERSLSRGVIFGKANYILNDKELNWTWPACKDLIDIKSWLNDYHPNHQASLVHRDIYKKEKYNIYYKISSDADFWYKIKSKNIKFYYLDDVIVNFELGGISNASNSLKVVKQMAIENTIINEFYNEGNFILNYFKFSVKFFYKFLLKKFLNEKKYYNYLKKRSEVRHSKYK